MADYPIPPATPPVFPTGPQLPFSRALTSGPLAEILAGFTGAPGDLQQLAQRAFLPPRSADATPVPSLPTQAQIMQAMAQQNAQPQSIYAMAPELTLRLMGAMTQNQTPLPAWLKDQSWLTNVIGAPGAPPPWFNRLTGNAPRPPGSLPRVREPHPLGSGPSGSPPGS